MIDFGYFQYLPYGEHIKFKKVSLHMKNHFSFDALCDILFRILGHKKRTLTEKQEKQKNPE